MQGLQENRLIKSGEYAIRKVLNQGSFGFIYLAYQRSLNREVAIKEFFLNGYCERDAGGCVSVLRSADEGLVERMRQKFMGEARALASLRHSHIVNVIDVWEENDTVYYSMSWLPGESLKDKVERHGVLDEVTALRYVGQVASALQYMHNRRMCHYDIKPGNILLDSYDNAVIIDFGNIKRYDAQSDDTVVDEGSLSISVGYSPVEQYKEITKFSPQCDIYALGATLYYLLTGKNPASAISRINGEDMVDRLEVMSPNVRDLINDATCFSPAHRLDSLERFMSSSGEDDRSGNEFEGLPRRLKFLSRESNIHLWTFVGMIGIAALMTCLVMYCVNYPGSIRQLQDDMVLVKGGTYIMGTTLEEDSLAYENEKPKRETVSDFYICKYEVTQELWQDVMGDNPSLNVGKKLPVENVSYSDCMEFIDKLNAMTGENYRLPTEAEWEYAARGGKLTRRYLFAGGNGVDSVAWYDNNSRDSRTDSCMTHQVGMKVPNELGLYDMTGNVMEWTCSENEKNEQDPSLKNGSGKLEANIRHTIRGGSCYSEARASRATYRRNYGTMGKASQYIGLRLVKSK